MRAKPLHAISLLVLASCGGGGGGGGNNTVATALALSAVTASSMSALVNGAPVTFTASCSGGTAPYSYRWDFGDGTSVQTTSAGSVSHTYIAAGTDPLTATCLDAAGRSAVAPGALSIVVTFSAGQHWQVALYPKVDWTGATYANGSFLVTGNFGTVLHSTDGVQWQASTIGESNEVRAATWGNSGYVAVGFGQLLAQSPDASTWTLAQPLNASVPPDFYTVAYGSGKYVAGGVGGIYYSSDGLQWSLANTGSVNYVPNVSYGNGMFATGPLYSRDGITWSNAAGWCSGTIAWGNGNFVGVSPGSPGQVCTSADGITWSLSGAPAPSGFSATSYLSFGNGKFFALNTSTVMASSDAITWSQVYSKADVLNPLTGLAASSSGYVLAGFGNILLHSTDLVTWTPVSNAPRAQLTAVDYMNGVFVSVGQLGTVLRSTDAVNWSVFSASPTDYLSSLIHVSGKFFATGATTIYSSSDGIQWTTLPLNIGGSLTAIAYGGNRFVAVGGGGLIITSTDAQNWTVVSSGVPATTVLKGVAYGAGKFVVVTYSGGILYSADGQTWSQGASGGGFWDAVTYGSSGFVAVGTSGVIWRSTDGLTWVPSTSGTTLTLYGITFANNEYVAVGDNGAVLTSQDGIQWAKRSPAVGEPLSAACFGNGTFVAVGGDGTVVTSSN